ncbi:MAG TPA: hypothetical protein VFB50_05435 [Chloroflexota bacterium]|nr:hypothetical protein [Chloroflexota bacterium]
MTRFHLHPTYPVTSEVMMKAAKEYGAANGWKGNHGGWISNVDGRAYTVQGWFIFFRTHTPQILDFYTAKLTGFDRFEDFVNTHPNYSPTIRPRTWREKFLADCFDQTMERRGQSRRAYRGI